MADGTDLSFVTLQEIWDELRKRSTAILVIIESEPKDAKENNSPATYLWAGSCSRAVGMCHRFENYIDHCTIHGFPEEMTRDTDE